MRSLTHLAKATALAVALAGPALATPSKAADYDAPDFRVVTLPGNQVLQLFDHADYRARVIAELPFDARGLEATGLRAGRFIEVTYHAPWGSSFTGWADAQFLSRDSRFEGTLYQVVNVGRGELVLSAYDDRGPHRVMLPGGSTNLVAAGPCDRGYCRVRYTSHYLTIEDNVPQANLAVSRLSSQVDRYPGSARYVNEGHEPPAYASGLGSAYNGLSPAPQADGMSTAPEVQTVPANFEHHPFLWRLFHPDGRDD
jgi:hypothetical protein